MIIDVPNNTHLEEPIKIVMDKETNVLDITIGEGAKVEIEIEKVGSLNETSDVITVLSKKDSFCHIKTTQILSQETENKQTRTGEVYGELIWTDVLLGSKSTKSHVINNIYEK